MIVSVDVQKLIFHIMSNKPSHRGIFDSLCLSQFPVISALLSSQHIHHAKSRFTFFLIIFERNRQRCNVPFSFIWQRIKYFDSFIFHTISITSGDISCNKRNAMFLSEENDRIIIRIIIIPQAGFCLKVIIRNLTLHIFIQNQLIVTLQHFRSQHQLIFMNSVHRTSYLKFQPMRNRTVMYFSQKDNVITGELLN